MTIFLDASAIIAMLAGEPREDELADELETETERLYSALSVWETIAGLRRSYGIDLSAARGTVDSLLRELKAQAVSIGQPESLVALDAYGRYGKGRHPAALNLADCFAYACAKTNKARRLYIGDDFSKTDLA